MKKIGVRRYSYLLFLSLILSQLTYGQETQPIINASLIGTVIDAQTREPIEGVTVQLESVTHLVKTDRQGKFQFITGQKLPFKVRVSFIGYIAQSLVIASSPAVIELRAQSLDLEEVVITGVSAGTAQKKLSFALTKINEQQINTVPAVDASQTLRAKVAGIQINQAGGNQESTIYLRGAKSVYGNIAPLLVVDGFVTGLGLSDLNPQDIQSIEVVKGAAASALYGTRGEGGVIQVITKKGNGRLNIVVDNEIGSSSIQREIETTPYHFYQVNDDGSFVFNGNNRIIDYKDNGFSVNLNSYQNSYNNLRSLFKTNQYVNNFVSLGTSTDKFRLYGSFQNQHKGSLITPLKEADTRQAFSLNLGYRPIENIETEVIFQYFNNSRPSQSIAVPSSFTGGSYNNTLLYPVLTYEPYIDLAEKDDLGNYLVSPTGTSYSVNKDVPNPFYVLSKREYANKASNLLIGGRVNYKLTDKIKAEVYGALQKEQGRVEDYYPVGFQTPTANLTLNNGYYGLNELTSTAKNGQLQITYEDKFGDFEFATALKGVYEETLLEGIEASGYTLTAPVKSLNVSAVETRSINSPWERTVNYGYFLNFRSGWRDKVFLDVLGRLDQSSRFGDDEATAFFPRVSAAYRVTKDINLGPVNELKLRVAYGQAGSLPPFGAKDSQVQISSSGGISYVQNENTALKRAVTEEIEYGFDAVLFNSINIQSNYAIANSKNDFIQAPAFTPTTGSASIYSNLGSVRSTSFELEVNGNVVVRNRFSWNTGITFSKVRSKITSLGGVPEFTATGGFRKAVGHNPLEFFGPYYLTSLDQLELIDGIAVNAGDGTLTLDDYIVNAAGYVVEKDKLGTAAELPVAYYNENTGNQTYQGSAQSDFNLGFSNTVTFGRFSLYGVLDWQKGGYKRNRTQQLITYRYRSTVTEDLLRHGLPLAFVDAVYGGEQYLWIEEAGYLSLRELSVSYALPVQRLFPNAKVVRQAKIALTGRNLYTWTTYNGVSPEGLYDSFDYPNYKVISGRLTVTF
ncbi:SusC/RagA family TonB-linked outer membrane protein [Sphingobacterium sp. LRF_L2]|uniref:SusC/RagA family TonB-linked outer membrane protein n=1 Tax=Sphingobacterium sp. LRF_L2 TaxID=3369421 RepID=UPI003F631C87